MPHANPEERRAYFEKYYRERRDALLQYQTDYRRSQHGKAMRTVWNKGPGAPAARVRAAEWYAANPNAQRVRAGLPAPHWPPTEFCECCGRERGKRAFALDHDHITGRFRGWLCGACNRGLGFLGDGIEGIQKALVYLQRAEWI